MGFLRRHLNYANVVASLALFLALGGAAFAATQLPRNSVGTGQLKPEAVTSGKIAKKTRNQLRGATGPQGPQGKTGKTGAKGATGARGATGATGARGANGTDGTGPAFEVFATGKTIGTGSTTVASQNLAAGAYVISADLVVESPEEATVDCVLNSGGEASGTIPAGGGATTLSLSVTATFGAASTATLTCSTDTSASERYANLIATQVRSVARAAG
jgi:hypothetical protein